MGVLPWNKRTHTPCGKGNLFDGRMLNQVTHLADLENGLIDSKLEEAFPLSRLFRRRQVLLGFVT